MSLVRIIQECPEKMSCLKLKRALVKKKNNDNNNKQKINKY